MEAPRKRPVGLYIGLAIILIVVIAGIAFVIFIVSFLNSPEGQRMKDAVLKSERVEGLLPEVLPALHQYVESKGSFPDSLSELRSHGAPEEALTSLGELMKYTKPAKEAPDATVILDTGKMQFIKGGMMQVQVTKDLKAFSIMKTPLEITLRGSPSKRG